MCLSTGWGGGHAAEDGVFFALIATTTMTSAASADCRILPGRFSMSQNTAVSTTAVSTRGTACGVRFSSSAVSHFNSVTVAKRPSHGALREVGALSYVYKPTGGVEGRR